MQAASASAVAAHADTNTPFLLESAAKHWSPEKPKGSLQHTLAPPPAVVTAMTSSDAAAQYALAANAAHDALAAHYAQHPAIHYSAGAASTPHEQLQHGASAASPYGSNGSYAPYGNTNPYGTQQNQAIAHQHAPMQLPSQLHPQQNQHQPPQQQQQQHQNPQPQPTAVSPKTTWETVEQQQQQQERMPPPPLFEQSTAQTTPTSSIPRLSLTQPSFSFTPTQAQWARQRLGEKLDLESPRLLESPRAAQRKPAVLKRVPWAHS